MNTRNIIRIGVFHALALALLLALALPALAEEGTVTGDIKSGASSAMDSLKDGANQTTKAIASGANKVGDYLDDATITTVIKGKFVNTKGLDAFDIRVKTNDGVVELSGQVDTQAQVTLAEEVAKQVDGVKKVENKISVKP